MELPTPDQFNLVSINEYVEVRMMELKSTKVPSMIHKPTGTIIKTWAMIEGLEQGAWWSMVDYAELAVQLEAVRWHSDDVDFLFPCDNFIERYLDPVGTGMQTVEEVSAKVMERIIRESA